MQKGPHQRAGALGDILLIQIEPHRIVLAAEPGQLALGVVAGGLFEFFGTLGLGMGALEVREILFVADGLGGGAEGIPVALDPLGLLQDARIHHPADP